MFLKRKKKAPFFKVSSEKILIWLLCVVLCKFNLFWEFLYMVHSKSKSLGS